MSFDLTMLPRPLRRVMVTGSRDWTDRRAVTDVLDTVQDLCQFYSWPMTLVHGAGRGVDGIADAWARTQQHWLIERHPADWRLGRRAGPLRNAEMVAAGADILLAFILHQSRGASGCAALAEAKGIPVWRWSPTPTEERP